MAMGLNGGCEGVSSGDCSTGATWSVGLDEAVALGMTALLDALSIETEKRLDTDEELIMEEEGRTADEVEEAKLPVAAEVAGVV